LATIPQIEAEPGKAPPNAAPSSTAAEDADTTHEEGQKEDHRTSPKQVAANRRNAMRSTGPRTLKGKEGSKFNATKHGLRASEIVIPGQEDPLEFEALLQELWDEWMPKGRTEISLVTEIGFAQWRLRRAHRAELGHIRKGFLDVTARDPAEEIVAENPHTPLPEVLQKSAKGIRYLEFKVELAMGELTSTGTVSRETCDALDKVFGDKTDNPAQMLRVWFLDEMSDSLRKLIEDTPLPAGIKPDKKAAARERLEMCWEDLERLRRKVRQREKLAGEIKLQRLSIPNGPELELIQRYETGIKRGMYRDIDQLERQQRRRGGEPPPPSVNVNVSSHDSD
jgi:hypothetical protein